MNARQKAKMLKKRNKELEDLLLERFREIVYPIRPDTVKGSLIIDNNELIYKANSDYWFKKITSEVGKTLLDNGYLNYAIEDADFGFYGNHKKITYWVHVLKEG